jgi:hypothetical protein
MVFGIGVCASIQHARPDASRVTVTLYVRNSNSHPARLVKLIATAEFVKDLKN